MNHITTFTGKHFDPTHPDLNLIDIKDIAHALSLTCRGNGHVKTFFSVAQHCIICALEAEARNYSNKIILACLIHDASEAYMSDVPRPFKKKLLDYQKNEEQLLNIIYIKYLGTPLTDKEKHIIKSIDDDMLYYDLKYLLNETPDRPEPKLHIQFKYQFIPFEEVEKLYLDLYEKYSNFI